MTKPTVLMTGPYTEWDMPVMEQDYSLLKLWEADDRDALIAALRDHGLRRGLRRGVRGSLFSQPDQRLQLCLDGARRRQHYFRGIGAK